MARYGIKALPHPDDPDDEDELDELEDEAPTVGGDSPPPPPGDTPPPEGTGDPNGDDAPPDDPRADDARPWAGDLYEEGDETDPADAFAAYSGPNGEEAWLDRAPDGTLTGWVRDRGQVWRYNDPDAWATDVDDAGMSRTHSNGQQPTGEPSAGGTVPEPLDVGGGA